MNLKRLVAATAGLLLVGLSPSISRAAEPLEVSSPDGNLTISFSLKENPPPYAAGQRAYYRVSYKGKTILTDSPLGLTFADGNPLDRDFEVVSTASEVGQHDVGEPLRSKTGRARSLQPDDRPVARSGRRQADVWL